MIVVEKLTKCYAGTTAVNAISFKVNKGDIVGFLGPNGAGKSTTMRMLASYLPPTSGVATVAGYDIFRDSLKAREHIGYMPEGVPLYQDMRVNEYLKYRAELKGVRGRRMKERLNDVYELCGLCEVQKKPISVLSKGFRQRVGLADVLLHEPDLLILDEPTIGLDPNQIRQMRELIRKLGYHHTILLSTHILVEVEMTCNRVIIINHGKIEVVDTPQNLRARMQISGQVYLEIRHNTPKQVIALLETLSGVVSVDLVQNDDEWCEFRLQTTHDPREAIFEMALKYRWPLRELRRSQVSLEDIFADITHAEEI
jgi:ABC-2 type transport system ATP-binding protein